LKLVTKFSQIPPSFCTWMLDVVILEEESWRGQAMLPRRQARGDDKGHAYHTIARSTSTGVFLQRLGFHLSRAGSGERTIHEFDRMQPE
jgi:hypothetical protein